MELDVQCQGFMGSWAQGLGLEKGYKIKSLQPVAFIAKPCRMTDEPVRRQFP